MLLQMVMTDMLHSGAFLVFGREVILVNPIQKCSIKLNSTWVNVKGVEYF